LGAGHANSTFGASVLPNDWIPLGVVHCRSGLRDSRLGITRNPALYDESHCRNHQQRDHGGDGRTIVSVLNVPCVDSPSSDLNIQKKLLLT